MPHNVGPFQRYYIFSEMAYLVGHKIVFQIEIGQ